MKVPARIRLISFGLVAVLCIVCLAFLLPSRPARSGDPHVPSPSAAHSPSRTVDDAPDPRADATTAPALVESEVDTSGRTGPSGDGAPTTSQPASPVAPDTTPTVDPPVSPPDEQPGLPGSVTQVVCSSGDMRDTITFVPPQEGGGVFEYILSRADSADGPFVAVASAGSDSRSFVFEVAEPGLAYYTVTAVGAGGAGAPSLPAVNAHVSIAAEVPPAGTTLRSSNGEVVLTLAEGSFADTTTVTIEEVSGSPTGGIVSLAGVYEITPSGPLGAPATLSVAYELAVTHHQVSDVLLRAAGLMTYDEVAGEWVSGARTIVADGAYLTGTVDHFSYWTGATVQPHGTSGTAVDYCSGVCHDLTAYPGSAVRYDSRDPQICYNCHGRDGSTLAPPAGAPGKNIQAEFYAISGQTRPASASTHPVAIGDLYCTACHDPHAAPASSPGLLKAWDPATGLYVQGGSGTAPGTAFCWTCHGTSRNRRIDYVVPGYYTRTGGDKKTRFTGGAHSAGAAATQRLDTFEELGRGVSTRVQVNPDGTVTLPTSPIELPKAATPVLSPVPSQEMPSTGTAKVVYDHDIDTVAYWNAAQCGASTGNGWIGTVNATFDLGAMTEVTSFRYQVGSSTYAADVLEIQTSTDNVTWTPLTSQGTLGTRLTTSTTLNGTRQCRYVRFVLRRDFSSNTNLSLYINELTIWGRPMQGSFDMRVDIPRNATYQGGTVRWSATAPASTSVLVTARASTDNGSTWTGPQAVTNGGALTQIGNGTGLQNAILEVTVSLGTSALGQTPTLDWLEVTTSRGAISGAPPAWTGEPMPNECERCHVPHGSGEPSLVNEQSTVQCTTCHTAAYGGSYFGPAEFAASAHDAVKCTGCHGSHGTASGPNGIYGFLLPDTRQELCFSCHTAVETDFEEGVGPAAEFAKHDIYAGEQAKTGSRIRCGNCHSVHSSTGLVNPDSITTPFAAYRDDPASIPTQQVTIYASKDTVIDPDTPTFNYGSATTVTLDSTNRILCYFDLSGIPAGATVQNASLILWTTTTPSGGYSAYPMTRDWVEGTGAGVLNSASVNGASWLEWRFGDNANTGAVDAGDWAAVGGDRGALAASNAGASANTSLNVTDLVRALKTGPNYGIMVTARDANCSFSTYLREHTTVKYRPKLVVWYQTGPATRQVLDDLAFCLKCHDGTMPMGLRGQSMTWIAGAYNVRPHGGAVGLGPESRTHSTDGGGGGLKYPYSYGMDPLPCTTCHDPHGSKLPFHIREVINGRDMTPLDVPWGYSNVIKPAMGMADMPSTGYLCGACHIYPSTHNREGQSGCAPCHGHSGSRGG